FAELDALLTEQLALRRGHEAGHTDILGLLLAARDEEGQPMTDVELKDELRTLLIAGHETTAIGMAWALYWTHHLPEVRRELLEELAPLGPVPAPEALTRLPYLSAVCDEALRIHPAVPLVSRRTLAPFTLRGHELPPGTGLMASVSLVHSNPELYPEPERFRPERFLERRFSPFEYLPFGGGARRCIGATFALHELRIVLGSLLAAHRFALAEDGPVRPVQRSITLGPAGGVRLLYLGPSPGAAEVGRAPRTRPSASPPARRSAAASP
ncbi:MAG TPA: cytochrome P450, partial [Myxococcaceae bacterium]|nr:cytochrome P450 [Myxococcaceae bacterium]